MSLPRKVQEQVAAAEARLKEITEPEAPEVEEPAPSPDDAPQAQETQSEPTASDEKEHVESHDDDDQKWQDRYKALQGKYNAEVPRLQKELKELKERVTDSQSNAALEAEIAQLKAQLAKPAELPKSDMINKIRDDYGNELADAFAAQKAENDALKNRLDEVLQATQQMKSTSSLDTLSRMLADKGINFEQQNNDPLFIDWLAEVDSFSGVSRQQLLSQAYDAGDLSRVTQFFVAYAGNSAPKKTEPKPKPSMEEHVKVPSNAPPKDTAPSDPVMWTQEQIREFYRNKTAGMYTPEEAERLENQLFTALRA